MKKKIIILFNILFVLSFIFSFSVLALTVDSDLIKQVQETLNSKGYDAGTADGIIGSRTNTAIEKYKKDNNLSIDSIIDEELLESMELITPSSQSAEETESETENEALNGIDSESLVSNENNIINSEEEQNNIVVETKSYRITMKDVELTDQILACNGEKADKETMQNAEEFFTPSDDEWLDENGYIKDGIHGIGYSDKNAETTFVYYNYEIQYIGTKDKDNAVYDFAPVVKYGKYTFDKDYFGFCRKKKNGTTELWYNFSTGFDNIAEVRALGLEFGYDQCDMIPLSETVYEVRGVIRIPRAASKDTETPLTFKIVGKDFEVKP